ncbi:DUF3348 domain-containing protein [Xanthomonas campestris pv. raphani]
MTGRMAKAPPRAPLSGPAFIRLLARLTDVHVAQSNHALADRLSQWIDWTRAVAVSKALDGKLPDAETLPEVNAIGADDCARLRTSLATSCVTELDTLLTRLRSEARAAAAAGAPAPLADYAPFRQHYLAMQRGMRSTTGDLRGRLRDMLAQSGNGEMARLAEVDAVMELTLSPREQSLLATVPTLLGTHFERLRAAHHPAQDTDTAPARPGSDAWLDVFRNDLQSVLLAELEVRFHPIEGLLAALRTR